MWLTGAIGGIQMVDPVIGSLALPGAGRGLGMVSSELALAASISTLFLASSVVLMGSLAERTGRRRMLTLGLLVTALGDVLAAVAPDASIFMVGRALAGVGVGAALACAYAYVRIVAPDEVLGRALGFWAAVTGISAVPMAMVGAGLANVNWRLAFLLVPAVSFICLMLVPRLLPATPKATEHRELVGVILAGIGVVAVLYAVSQTAKQTGAVEEIIVLLVGLVLIAIAGFVGSRAAHPSFPVWVFRDPGLLTAALAGALWNMCLAVVILQSSNLWQYVDGATPFLAAVLQVPASVAVAVGSLVMGRLMSRRIDFRILMAVGFLLSAVGFAVVSLTSSSAFSVWFNLGMVGVGLGAGAAGTVQSQVLLDAAPPGYLSAIAASRTTFGQVGYAIGLAGSAVVTTLLATSALVSSEGLNRDSARTQLNDWLMSVHGHVAGSGGPVAEAYRRAFAEGMMWWAGVVLVSGLSCVVLLTVKYRGSARGGVSAIVAGRDGNTQR